MPVGDSLTESQYEALRQEGWLPPAMRGELIGDLQLVGSRIKNLHRETRDLDVEVKTIVSRWT